MNELKKIEARKKERERKTQDLQKLISQADSGRVSVGGSGTEPSNVISPNTGGSNTHGGSSSSSRRHDRKLHKKKVQSHSRPIKSSDVIVRLCFFYRYLYDMINSYIFVLEYGRRWYTIPRSERIGRLVAFSTNEVASWSGSKES